MSTFHPDEFPGHVIEHGPRSNETVDSHGGREYTVLGSNLVRERFYKTEITKNAILFFYTCR